MQFNVISMTILNKKTTKKDICNITSFTASFGLVSLCCIPIEQHHLFLKILIPLLEMS